MTRSVLTFLKHAAETIKHVWSDARFPGMAKILLVLAPLYWLLPFDLRCDFLSGGFIDDLIIVPCLIAAGLRLIPRIVYVDARKAGLGAACGLLCVSLTTLSARSAADHSETTGQSVSQIALKSMSSTQKCPSSVMEVASGPVGAVQLNRETQQISPQNFVGLRIDGGDLIDRKVQADLSPMRSRFALLVLRGGQSQLFGTDADLAGLTDLAYRLTVPPHVAGGIFMTATEKKLLVIAKISC